MLETSTTPSPSTGAPLRAAWHARWRAHGRALAAVIAAVIVGGTGGFAVWVVAQRPPAFVWQPAVTPPLSPGKQVVELVFAGDISVARGVARQMTQAGGDPGWLLQHVRPIFDAADLVFANLECVLGDPALPAAKKKFTIRGDPDDARALVAGGVDVVSVANNHAMDFLYPGFFQTLQATSALGLRVTGVAEEDGQRLLVVPVGQMTVGFLAYNAHGDEWFHLDFRPRAAPYDIEAVLADVARARPQVDHLVVSLHWGNELSHEPQDWQRADAHRLVDAGVDLVIGHHPHVQQPVESYKNGLIAYSLGDLAFDKKAPWLRHRTSPRFLLAVGYDGKARTGFRLIPIHHETDHRPRPAPAQDTASLLEPSSSSPPLLWRAADHVEQARVVRAGQPCASFATTRSRLNGGWLRWVARRWVCPGEQQHPGDSVGRSSELSGTVLRTGVWASPGGGDVVVSFAGVPVGRSLRLVAGFPDWAVQAAGEAGKEPVDRTVTVEVRRAGATVHVERVPVAPGWRTVELVDQAAGAGDVNVVVRGPRLPQPGFLFDLEVR
ncbi:MAG: CapA family protein [Deltaproteobacteria bacterium]|nr:CapA family protein [Deltaproteobacteria bacterium]